jgi:CheY-like chemotaxis protein
MSGAAQSPHVCGDRQNVTLMTSRSPLRILLVDDAAEMRALLRALLADQAGIIVTEADSGEQALALAAADRPDLVIMDHHMPGMDGVTATRHLKEMDEGIEIVAFTAVPGNERDFALAGAIGHFRKDMFNALVAFISQRATTAA